MNDITTNEQAELAYKYVQQIYEGDKFAVIGHTTLAQELGGINKDDVPNYYGIISLVRSRLKTEGMLLQVVVGVGYKFLTAAEHGEHAMRKIDLAIKNVDAERQTLSMCLERIDAGEEAGFDEVEKYLMACFERDLDASVAKARSLAKAFGLHNEQLAQQRHNEAGKAKELIKAQGQLAAVKDERSKLRGLARRQARKLEKAKAKATSAA